MLTDAKSYEAAVANRVDRRLYVGAWLERLPTRRKEALPFVFEIPESPGV